VFCCASHSSTTFTTSSKDQSLSVTPAAPPHSWSSLPVAPGLQRHEHAEILHFANRPGNARKPTWKIYQHPITLYIHPSNHRRCL
jgi:hypothetical protein